MTNLPREQWLAALSQLPHEQLETVVGQLSQGWKIMARSLPQAGLGMLKMRDGALGEDFYLGEFPLASCWIHVETNQGQTAEGAAWIMEDEQARAEQMALCDAILAERLPGWEQVMDLLEQGLEIQKQAKLERKSLLARTRVDFSLLDDAGDEDD